MLSSFYNISMFKTFYFMTIIIKTSFIFLYTTTESISEHDQIEDREMNDVH